MNASLQAMRPRSPDTVVIARTKELEDSRVKAVNIDGIDLIVLRHANAISIFQGRCPHEGTLLSEGTIKDGLLTCRAHDWQFNCSSGCKQGLGVSDLKRFDAIIEDGDVKVDRNEVQAWNAKRSAPDHKTPHRASPVRSLSQLPGPKRIPFRGTTLHLQPERLHLVLEQWSREFGPVYTFRLIGRPFVAIADPILIHQVLRDRPGAYRRWNTIETVARELGINGVFSTEGDAWRRQRQLVAKALDPLHLRALFPSLCEMTRRLLQRWESATLAQQAIDIQNDLMRYTLDVTTNLALGYDMGTIDGQGQGDVIQRHLEVMFPAINRRINAPFPVWRDTRRPVDKALDRALIAVQALTKELIAANRARLAQRSAANAIPANLLEALLMAQQEGEAPLTDDEVLANVFTILLAGQDTTASTIAWVAYFVASHPEVQRKMQEEVDARYRTCGHARRFRRGRRPPLSERRNQRSHAAQIGYASSRSRAELRRPGRRHRDSKGGSTVVIDARGRTAARRQLGGRRFRSGPLAHWRERRQSSSSGLHAVRLRTAPVPGTQPRFDGSEIGSGHAVPQLRPVAGQSRARGRGSVRVFDGAAEPARRTASAGLVDPSTQVRLPSVRDNRADAKLHGALTTARRATHTMPLPR